MEILERSRRTGRTTRMMQEAIEQGKRGRAVYIIVHRADYGEDLRHRFPESVAAGVKFETWQSLRNLDAETLRLRDAHPNCAVLVDHFAIETRYGKLLEEWARYDL